MVLLLMIMVGSYLRILGFAKKLSIFCIFLQHLKVLKHLVAYRSLSPFCVKVKIEILLKILAVYFFKL